MGWSPTNVKEKDSIRHSSHSQPEKAQQGMLTAPYTLFSTDTNIFSLLSLKQEAARSIATEGVLLFQVMVVAVAVAYSYK